jgi:hypothetical protein
MNRKLITAMSFGVGITVSGSVAATVITYSTDFSISSNFNTEVAGSFNVPLNDFDLATLPRFDGSLGALQNVDISFESTYSAYFSGFAEDEIGEADFVLYPPFVVNDRNDTGIAATLQNTLTITLFDPSSSSRTLNIIPPQDYCYESVSADQYVSCTIRAETTGSFNGSLPTDLFSLTDFIGADSINLSTSLTGLLSGDCDSNDKGDYCEISKRSRWFGDITVSYTYNEGSPGGDGGSDGDPTTTVPEPTILSLLGMGLISLIGLTRRKA